MEVDNLTVADVAYPLVTKRLTGVFQQQLVHVRNGCISDDLERLPYVKVGKQSTTTRPAIIWSTTSIKKVPPDSMPPKVYLLH